MTTLPFESINSDETLQLQEKLGSELREKTTEEKEMEKEKALEQQKEKKLMDQNKRLQHELAQMKKEDDMKISLFNQERATHHHAHKKKPIHHHLKKESMFSEGGEKLSKTDRIDAQLKQFVEQLKEEEADMHLPRTSPGKHEAGIVAGKDGKHARKHALATSVEEKE